MTDATDIPVRSHFQKDFEPYGVRITEETLDEIDDYDDCEVITDWECEEVRVEIETREGTLKALWGDWIMEDSEGSHYPIAHEELMETYEPVDDTPEPDDPPTQEHESTPGPWRYNRGAILSDADEGRAHISKVANVLCYSPKHGDEAEANGHLIAAAPRLRAALHNLIQEAKNAADALEALGDDGDAGMLRLQINEAQRALDAARGG